MILNNFVPLNLIDTILKYYIVVSQHSKAQNKIKIRL